MDAHDIIGGTVGRQAKHVAIGKDIVMVGMGGDNDVPDRDKLDEVLRLVYMTSERVAKLETWVQALMVAFVLAGIVVAWRLL